MLPPIYTTLQASSIIRGIFGARPRIYRMGEAPAKTSDPYAVWQLVSGVPENQLSGTPGHDRDTVQIDIYSTTDSGCEQAAIAVRDQMETVTHMTAYRTLPRDTETRNFRISMDFDYWYAREA